MKPKSQKITVIIVFILVIVFGVGQFFARAPIVGTTAPSAPNSSTEIITYTPGMPASSTPIVKGSCWTSSIAAPYRADAWRCAVGNGIQDPCFQIGDSTNTLLCGMNPADPAATSSFVLSLTKPLPAPAAFPAPAAGNWAWLLKLQDGTLCSPFEGTRPFDAQGDAAEYGCAPQSPGGPARDIFGDLNASSGVWTAETGILSVSTSTFPPPLVASSVVPVATVWQ
jgi:hypothetical protein